MNEVAPSSKTSTLNLASAPDDEPSEAPGNPLPAESLAPASLVPETRVVSPIIWALQLWTVASFASLILAGGLSPALRGAFVGNDEWILRVDHAAALTSQVAAMCTTVLLIYMGLLVTRASRTLGIGIGAALLGIAPTMIVFYAHRLTLPQFHGWISAICASLSLLLCASQVRGHKMAQAVVLSGGAAYLFTAFRTGGMTGDGSELASLLSTPAAALGGIFTLTFASLRHLVTRGRKPLRAAVLLGLAILCAATVPASSLPNVPDWALVVGRTIGNLAPKAVFLGLAPFAISFALISLVSTLLSRPGSLTQLLCSLIALGVLAPATPLVSAWLTLCGYSVVVSCWQPEHSPPTAALHPPPNHDGSTARGGHEVGLLS